MTISIDFSSACRAGRMDIVARSQQSPSTPWFMSNLGRISIMLCPIQKC